MGLLVNFGSTRLEFKRLMKRRIVSTGIGGIWCWLGESLILGFGL